MKWYVAQVTTGQELAVRDALQAVGIHAKVPQEERQIRKGGNWLPKMYVLMPGYVFLGCDDFNADIYYTGKRIPALIRYLGDTKPQPITHLEAEYIGILAPSNEPLQPSVVENGQVMSGVLTRLPGEIVKIDERQRRAKVRLTLLGEEKQVDFTIRVPGEDEADGEE